MGNIRIAIDGPAGAGKSTIAKYVAKTLGYLYIDTGAMYRAVGLEALRRGLDTKADIPQIDGLMEEIVITISHTGDGQAVFLNGEDVTGKLRTPEVSVAASDVSAIPSVRLGLVALQRRLAQTEHVVMDGRDIGSFVLPDAQIKIFLTASLEERARRRYEELLEKGMEAGYDAVKADMLYRDTNDAGRALAPLVAAEDAVVIDTTGNSLEKSSELLLRVIKERLDCFSR